MKLYQQGVQKIEIIVRKDSTGGQQGAKEVDTDNVSTSDTSTAPTGSTGLSGRKKYFLKTNITHGLMTAKHIADLGVNYIVGTLGQRYGDEALQESVERTIEIVTDVSGFASSVAMGVVYGAGGGVPGMIIGATLGAASSGSSLVAKYATRHRDFQYKVFKENNAIAYQRARASISLTTGRLR